jgi:hypothetical protein
VAGLASSDSCIHGIIAFSYKDEGVGLEKGYLSIDVECEKWQT